MRGGAIPIPPPGKAGPASAGGSRAGLWGGVRPGEDGRAKYAPSLPNANYPPPAAPKASQCDIYGQTFHDLYRPLTKPGDTRPRRGLPAGRGCREPCAGRGRCPSSPLSSSTVANRPRPRHEVLWAGRRSVTMVVIMPMTSVPAGPGPAPRAVDLRSDIAGDAQLAGIRVSPPPCRPVRLRPNDENTARLVRTDAALGRTRKPSTRTHTVLTPCPVHSPRLTGVSAVEAGACLETPTPRHVPASTGRLNTNP